MLELEKRQIDRDLVVLDTIDDSDALPQRDWESIINIIIKITNLFP